MIRRLSRNIFGKIIVSLLVSIISLVFVKTTLRISSNAIFINKNVFEPNGSFLFSTFISFSLNHSISSNLSGDWTEMNYGLLIPIEKILDDEIVNLSATDSFSFGNLKLKNRGVELIISDSAYKTKSPRELERMKKRTGAEIITFQKHFDKNIDETIKRRIKERGYELLSPRFYDDFDGSQASFKDDVGEIAKEHNKLSTMHAWTPLAEAEKRVSFINKEGYNFKGGDHRTYLNESLENYESEILKSRNGRLSKKDKATLQRLDVTLKNAGRIDLNRVNRTLRKK